MTAMMQAGKRLALYVAVAALVLAYVSITAPDFPAANADGGLGSGGAAAAGASRGLPLPQRLGLAAGFAFAWIALDWLIVSRLAAKDQATYFLVRVVVGWCLLLGLGAMLGAGNQRFAAAAIVLAVAAGFVGLWIGALFVRSSKGGTPSEAEEN